MNLLRRQFLAALSAAAASGVLPAFANVPKPYSWDIGPPTANGEAFVAWMQQNRGEDLRFLRERWDRFEVMVGNRDLVDDRDKRAFLLTPREDFVLSQNRDRA